MDRNTVNSPPLYFPRYVVRTLQVQLSDTSVRDVCFIYTEDRFHIPIRVTNIQDYVSEGRTGKSPLNATTGNRCQYFCQMLNYILVDNRKRYGIDCLLQINKPMMDDFFIWYAGHPSEDGSRNTQATVNTCVRVCANTMAGYARAFPGKTAVSIEEMLKWGTIVNHYGERVSVQLPNFPIYRGEVKESIFRDLNSDAMTLLLRLVFEHDRGIFFAVCCQVFTGMRAGEVCNMWQESDPYGPCIRIAYDSAGFETVSINVMERRRLRADNVSVGRIKKPRIVQVYTEFVHAFLTAWESHREWLSGQNFDHEYSPMFLNSQGRAMTWDNYDNRLERVVRKWFCPALHDSGDRTLKLMAEEIERRGFGSHAFRHFFTVQLVLRGVSPAELARWRGDRSIESAVTYYQNKGEINAAARMAGAKLTESLLGITGGNRHE